MAEASGVPARQIFFLLLTLVALTVVVSLKTVGAILVFAMILIPASTAYQLTHSLTALTLYSATIGVCYLHSGRPDFRAMGCALRAGHRAVGDHHIFYRCVLLSKTCAARTTRAFALAHIFMTVGETGTGSPVAHLAPLIPECYVYNAHVG